tara:strand:+ start:476 stop:973 length:498 start_codon:yes stop_codon:yes gene_type:complete
MPNWCNNSISLRGREHHRKEFVDKNKGYSMWDNTKVNEYNDLSFHASVPCPKKHLQKNGKPTTDNGWYVWSNKHWGTKWEASNSDVTHSENYTNYSFETAWGSPVEYIKKVSRMYPQLEFHVTWAEEGGEGGTYMYHNGNCVYDTQMTTSEWHEFQGYEEEEDEE